MNPVALKGAEKLFADTAKGLLGIKNIEVVACPPFLYLEKLKKISKKISLGSQDAFWEGQGAFTGEISSEMLYNLGMKYVILGHSERRTLGENNNDINKKIKSALSAGLIPVLCVGESLRDENHEYFNLVKNQIEECLSGISKNLISKVIVAYEPVWAISSTINRKDAIPADSLEMAIFIRKILADKFGKESSVVRILYGGSVNERDAVEFLKDGGVEGLLVGRASLDAKKFLNIIKTCETLNR